LNEIDIVTISGFYAMSSNHIIVYLLYFIY